MKTPILTVLLLLATTASAEQMRAPVRAQYQQGLSAYEDKRYAEAIEAFQAAYQADPRPEILFAWAQAERLSGDCDSAVPLYRKVLEQTPEARRDAIETLIARCEASRPRVPSPAVAAAMVEPLRERPPFYRDALGNVLVGTGVVAVGAGVTLLIMSGSNDAATYGEFGERSSSAKNQRIYGSIALAAGVGLTTAGILRWVLRAPKQEGPNITFSRKNGATFVGLASDL